MRIPINRSYGLLIGVLVDRALGHHFVIFSLLLWPYYLLTYLQTYLPSYLLTFVLIKKASAPTNRLPCPVCR